MVRNEKRQVSLRYKLIKKILRQNQVHDAKPLLGPNSSDLDLRKKIHSGDRVAGPCISEKCKTVIVLGHKREAGPMSHSKDAWLSCDETHTPTNVRCKTCVKIRERYKIYDDAASPES